MRERRTHGIGEQNTAYRRGIVLGLTMGEVGILIIFVLLLLIAFGEHRRQQDARSMLGKRAVSEERLQTLEQGDSLLKELRRTLEVADGTNPEEISRLVRELKSIASTPAGQTMLEELRAVRDEVRRIREAVGDGEAAEKLAAQVESQSFRVANQEGQLKRYEVQLKETGLGKGERPCWVKPDGTIEYLYEVVLGSDGIRMREYLVPDRARERSLLPMPRVDSRENLRPDEFLGRTQPLYSHSLAANCRFFVVIYDATGPTEKDVYKQLLRTVEGHFYKRLDRGRAPF